MEVYSDAPNRNTRVYRARSIQPKFQPARPGKSSPPQKVDPFFSKIFRLDRTDPFPEILVEWIAPINSLFLSQIKTVKSSLQCKAYLW